MSPALTHWLGGELIRESGGSLDVCCAQCLDSTAQHTALTHNTLGPTVPSQHKGLHSSTLFNSHAGSSSSHPLVALLLRQTVTAQVPWRRDGGLISPREPQYKEGLQLSVSPLARERVMWMSEARAAGGQREVEEEGNGVKRSSRGSGQGLRHRP
ncbi:hypothetical protein DPEC_G00308910 [Dallia pectoralis]|uniref:Uncharacterized protein n=1 Tax=Dallia pectoralis TaxID=75939 RepID=A0ACC2FF27_DALPE|nr:hypothetical protein DPEC_G00308910 [Dallia pectoralis]